jgi:hypothetical protein
MGLVLMTALCPLSAEAAKKKKGGGDAELQKNLEPIAKVIDELNIKVQSRLLFSPKDSGQLSEVKYKLLDLLKDNATNPLMVKPLYQAAVLYTGREQFTDAYELFSYLSTNFPETPYGIRAKNEMFKLKKMLGDDYFVDDTAPPAPAGANKAEKK